MNLIGNNKRFFRGQNQAEKENNRDKKSVFGNEVNSSCSNNSMFIVDWQIRNERTIPV